MYIFSVLNINVHANVKRGGGGDLKEFKIGKELIV